MRDLLPFMLGRIVRRPVPRLGLSHCTRMSYHVAERHGMGCTTKWEYLVVGHSSCLFRHGKMRCRSDVFLD